MVSRGDDECSGDGDCCEAHETPGCADPACCETVCATYSSCCSEEWYSFCAAEASHVCIECGAGAPCPTPALCDGDVNGDGVLDPLDTGYIRARFGADACGEGNCPADANCDGLIDPLDIGYVLARYGECNPVSECVAVCPPGNDDCEDAYILEDGLTPFSNILATTDGPEISLKCECGFACSVGDDIWYNYTAPCGGFASISTCNDDDPGSGEADFDTYLIAYEGCDCPADNDFLVGCNDDGPGCSGFTSIMEFDTVEGVCYKISVSGFFGGNGTGVLAVNCKD